MHWTKQQSFTFFLKENLKQILSSASSSRLSNIKPYDKFMQIKLLLLLSLFLKPKPKGKGEDNLCNPFVVSNCALWKCNKNKTIKARFSAG